MLLPETETRFVGCPSRSLVAILTKLSQFPVKSKPRDVTLYKDKLFFLEYRELSQIQLSDLNHTFLVKETHTALLVPLLTQGHCFRAKVKGKSIQVQAHSDPESSRKLGLPDFKVIGT